MSKNNNISSEKMNSNNSKEKNNPILFLNKNKGIVLNKVNIFKNVKFKKPSLNTNISKGNKIDNKLNNNTINSNTNTIVQSVSSLNMTSTDITTSTKRIKDNNIFNIENKLIKEKENNKEMNLLRNNTNINIHNQTSNFNTNDIKKNKNNNINKPLFNITNLNTTNAAYSNINTLNNINTIYQFYKGILPATKNLLNKNKKPKNINLSLKKSKKSNNTQKKIKNFKNKRSTSQYNIYEISKKVTKPKKNLSLYTITKNASKKDDNGGTIISDDSVFNISKRRSSSGTHNDSSKLSKGSGTMSFDKKSKSISIDYTYSDDEVQTNRRKKGNQIQINIDDKDSYNKKIFVKENDVNINNKEFKNFCEDLSSKLFGK